ncbi:hypothetical protein Pyn_37554 [Prunus yedoensis var. nudiflora]|uniref:Uncharacterized protein n=1 Tax=Prunus yedoensis var. nudiflora TaxID=2094558 RepID=A0A314YTR3_PRUYE|nr:hypothetical protein Pyn_37554 [Prunus yedoensis var. nudiflora]
MAKAVTLGADIAGGSQGCNSGHRCDRGTRPNVHCQVGIIIPDPPIFINRIIVSPRPHREEGRLRPGLGRNLGSIMVLAHIDFPRRETVGGQQREKSHLGQARLPGREFQWIWPPWFWKGYNGGH